MNGNVTMIEQLPELEEMERGDGRNFQKFIRSNYRPNAESGMTSDANRAPMGDNSNIGEPQEMIQDPRNVHFQEEFYQNRPTPLSYHCIDIANHIGACPICSKFYRNDKSIYVIVIIVLIIICLLLMKKILNV